MTKDKGLSRARSDSVLEGRMDSCAGYSRLRSTAKKGQTESNKWSKLKKLIDKPSTKLILIEAPKGVSIRITLRLK